MGGRSDIVGATPTSLTLISAATRPDSTSRSMRRAFVLLWALIVSLRERRVCGGGGCVFRAVVCRVCVVCARVCCVCVCVCMREEKLLSVRFCLCVADARCALALFPRRVCVLQPRRPS